jgi:nucleotidyltransferase/DNA polymerase involved in DNA repair
MDAFFAAIEQRERPELRGKPVLIGHPGRRGVVATCSYEARPFGVHSAMPSVTAARLCPDAVWVAGRMGLYKEVSRRIFALLDEIAPIVERVSIDEAYADLTGVAPELADAAALARTLKERIREQERLTASAGVAPCRFLAKIASDLEKPDGLVLLPRDEIPRRLWPLPVRVIPGVGPKMSAQLGRLGVRTVGELARLPEEALRRRLGARTARFLARRARGLDDAPIVPEHERKQISEERTYVDDLHDRHLVERELLVHADAVAAELRRRELVGRTVVLKVRDERFHTVTRSHTLEEPTDLAREIHAVAVDLFRRRIDLGGRGVRLLGVGVKELRPLRELPPTLFPDEARERARAAARTADALRARFGRDALRPASLLQAPRPTSGPSAAGRPTGGEGQDERR